MTEVAALGLLVAGLLLVALECNRPGKVLPGALGLLLALIGFYRLSAFPMQPSVPWLLGCGLASILVLWWRPLRGVPALVGTLLLVMGFEEFARSSGGSFRTLLAAGCGGLLGLLSSALFDIARRARVAKRPHRGARPAQGAANGSGKQWGVD